MKTKYRRSRRPRGSWKRPPPLSEYYVAILRYGLQPGVLSTKTTIEEFGPVSSMALSCLQNWGFIAPIEPESSVFQTTAAGMEYVTDETTN